MNDLRLPSEQAIKRAYKLHISFSNQILYEMCSAHPNHDDSETIQGKLMLIGRTYSASLERKTPEEYRNKLYPLVGDAIVKSDIGTQIDKLKNKEIEAVDSNDIETIGQILNLHSYFINTLTKYTRINKRSLASKYLHFHLPNMIYIYDSRARTALHHIHPDKVPHPFNSGVDYSYANFFVKILTVRDAINQTYHKPLDPRQMDNLLLKF